MAIVVTRLWAEWFWVRFLMVQEIFVFSKMCRLPVVPPSLLFSACWLFFPGGYSSWGMEQATHLHPLSGLRVI